MTNVKHIGISLAAIMALSTQGLLAEEPTVATDRDSSYSTDFQGTLGGTLGDGPCNGDTGIDFKISQELLLTEPFDRNMSTGIFTLGVSDPSTISDPTVEITFPANIMDIDQIESLEYDIIDINATAPGTALTFSHRDGGSSKIVYDASASTDLFNGHTYCIATGGAVANNPVDNLASCADLPYYLDKNTSAGTYSGDIEWSVFSNSGTSERRDYGKLSVKLIVEPQFSIKCIADLDGLINWENGRKSFVANKHDVDGGVAIDEQNTTVDTLIFEVVNAAGTRVDGSCNGLHTFDLWLDGNETEFDIVATNDIDLNTSDWNLTLTSSRAGVSPGSGGFSTEDTAHFVTANQEIFNGITQYHASYDYSTGYANGNPIEATTFSGDVALAGFADVRPLVSMSNRDDLGEWKDHAFIAQIAGGSVTKYDDADTGMQTKLFIVNRSCSTATPVINLVMGGDLIPLTGLDPIEPNQQGFIDIGEVLHDMGKDVSGYDYAKFGFEVTLAGEAEDFYMYAQVKNIAIDQFKDLPVYTTSNRN